MRFLGLSIIKRIKELIKNSKAIILLIVFLVITGGFFYWWKYWETPFEEWDKVSLSRPQDYEINDLAEEIVIENKKAGMVFKTPKDWEVKRAGLGNYIILYGPGTVGRTEEIQGIEKGCEIVVAAMAAKTSIGTIEKQLKDLHKKWEYQEKYEPVEVSGHKALKNITGIPALDMYGIGVHVPIKKLFSQSRLYYLSISSSLKNQESCFQEFDQFLETVFIQ